jgi:hypothetical protein
MINLFKSANLSNVFFTIVSITMCFLLFLFLKSNGFVASDIFGMQNGEGES